MSIATLDPPAVYDAPTIVVVPESETVPVPVRDPSTCYLCGGIVAVQCELCGKAVCTHCYRIDYGPCLIERDWCIPCANAKARERDEKYAAYQARYGHEPDPLPVVSRPLSSRPSLRFA